MTVRHSHGQSPLRDARSTVARVLWLSTKDAIWVLMSSSPGSTLTLCKSSAFSHCTPCGPDCVCLPAHTCRSCRPLRCRRGPGDSMPSLRPRLVASGFQSLRSGAMKGLNSEGAGCNSWLHLGLVEHPLHDPQYWSIMHTFLFARECAIAPAVEATLAQLVSGSTHIPENSISSTLLTRLQTLGWHVTPSGLVRDQLGSFLCLIFADKNLTCAHLERGKTLWQQKCLTARVLVICIGLIRSTCDPGCGCSLEVIGAFFIRFSTGHISHRMLSHFVSLMFPPSACIVDVAIAVFIASGSVISSKHNVRDSRHICESVAHLA